MNDLKVEYGSGTTKFGPGVLITLSANDVAIAIHAYLVAHRIVVRGPRTVRGGSMCVYVDPSGYVIAHGKKFSGRGKGDTDGD